MFPSLQFVSDHQKNIMYDGAEVVEASSAEIGTYPTDDYDDYMCFV